MRRASVIALSAILLLGGASVHGQNPPPKFEDLLKFTQGMREFDGLFKLYQKDETVFAEIQFNQLDRNFLCPIAIAQGLGQGGVTQNFDEQWVLSFRRVGDKVQLVRRNVRFRARSGSAVARAVETTYTDSVLLALKIHAQHPFKQSLLISLNDIFMTDFAQLNLGYFDANRSSWAKIKTYPRNVELEVAATFGNSRGNNAVIDRRGATVVIHYGLVQMPDEGYQSRFADDRVGYFLSVVKDYSDASRETPYLRYVNRWRLDRSDNDVKGTKLVAPKKKIVFWIENSVPEEYRAYVREGILEWNKAFEKIGFRDAIEVRQQEGEDFDPEDMNYNTFRWVTNDGGYAMGPSRANPLTGELLDADIVFDGSFVRYWKSSYGLYGDPAASPISLIKAGRLGWGLHDPLQGPATPGTWNDPKDRDRDTHEARLLAMRHGACQCGAHMQYELGLAAITLLSRELLKPGEKLPEEFLGQAVKEVVMHEVGHTLGLRHNFKASTMLKNDQLHDVALTRKQGLIGSVMDYAPINFAPKGVKQGDYFTTTLGPYDYWAIEYAYRPLSGGTEGEWSALQDLAKKGAQAGLDFGPDEDLFATSDPLINQWDLGADPMKYGQDRLLLSEELLKSLADKTVDNGEGYQRVREAFATLLRQYGDAAYLVVRHIGGERVHRDHRGDPNGRDPFVPVAADKQRDSLKFLQEHILTDKPFQFAPALLRKLAADRWMHWGTEGAAMRPVEFPVHDRILEIHRVALEHVCDGTVLARIQDNALKADKDEKALQMAEVFRGVTDAVWNDLPERDTKKEKPTQDSTVVRRNLQREHLRQLGQLILRSRGPADARSLARLHLRELSKRIEAHLNNNTLVFTDVSRAHLEESQERIAKVLNAAMQTMEP